jgi:hypothetical protein
MAVIARLDVHRAVVLRVIAWRCELRVRGELNESAAEFDLSGLQRQPHPIEIEFVLREVAGAVDGHADGESVEIDAQYVQVNATVEEQRKELIFLHPAESNLLAL